MTGSQRKWIGVLLILILATVLVGCSSDEPTPTPVPLEPTAEPPPTATAEPEVVEPEEEPTAETPGISQPIYRWGEVADRLWVLVGYGDAANPTVVEEGTVVTAVFSSVEPTVSGSGGCNNYFAEYESTDEGDLTISGPIGSTMMACEIGAEQEAAYFAALETVSGWTLNEEGRLELAYDRGEPYDEVLVFAPGETPLTGTTWRLVSYGDPDDLQQVLPGTSVTAVFSPETDTSGTVGGSATCNSYTTSYTLDGSQINFGLVAGTLMMCPIGADQEATYLEALASAQTFEIAGANMQITYDGGVLNFTSLDLPLENVLWQALSIAGEPVPEGVEITALFAPGEEVGMGIVGGNAGCNSFSTDYETDGESLTVSSPMAMTLMACPDEALANLEQAYLAALETAEGYETQGNQLVVTAGEGEIIFVADRQPLLGTLWVLTSLGDAAAPQLPVEGSNFTAQFSRLPNVPSGTVTGETGCNDYNAAFAADLTEIKINLPAKTNNEDCPWGEGDFEVEQQFFLAMNAATEYRILGHVLQLLYDDGNQVLNFEATAPEGEEAIDLAPLDDTFWYLSAIGANPLVSYSEITAGFDVNDDGVTGAVSGSGGCNAYNAAIEAGEGAFAIGPIASTSRACDPEVMEQEGGYFDWLSSAYDYDRAGDQLLISTANGVLTFNSTPVLDQSDELRDVTWYLVSAGTFSAVPGSNATTLFASDGQTVNGNTGCNEFSGSYRAEPGNSLTISGFSSTQAACTTEALASQEEAMLVFLQSAVSYTVVGNVLQIQTVDGSTVNYTSVPPAQPIPPTAAISGASQGDVGQPLNFDGSGSSAGSSPIVRYQWDMGDGTTLTGPTVQHAYNAAGSYQVSLTVADRAGASNTATQTVQVQAVEAQPPTAAIDGPDEAFVGQSVTFSAANSTPGTGAITNYIWNSGDGHNSGQVPDNSFTTIYARPGTFYASVTVVDENGLSDTVSRVVTINANLDGTDWILQNTIAGTTISLNFANGSMTGFAGCNSYNASFSTTLAAGPTNDIMVGPVTSTSASCSQEIMDQEQAYFNSIQAATSYSISGTTLTLTTSTGTLIFEAAVATPLPAQ